MNKRRLLRNEDTLFRYKRRLKLNERIETKKSWILNDFVISFRLLISFRLDEFRNLNLSILLGDEIRRIKNEFKIEFWNF